MRRLSSYPHWFFSVMLVILLVLLASGLLLLPPMLEMRMEWESPLHVSGDWRLAGAALHSTSAFLSMILLGALSIVHMRMGWRRHLNRISGVGLLILFSVSLLTAIGMFYFGDADLSRVASILHTITGLVIVLLFCWHLEKGRRIRVRMAAH